VRRVIHDSSSRWVHGGAFGGIAHDDDRGSSARRRIRTRARVE
jgi:hypothetical protein